MSGLNVTTANGVARLVIDRPEVSNRIDRATALAIAAAMAEADANPDVRAVVITATGEKFCIGGQVDGGAEGKAIQQVAFAQAFAGMHAAAAKLGKPLIAAINGDAIAGGFSLMAATDLAITVESAKFGLPELHAGLFPMLALATSVRLLPRKLLFDIVYNGRLLTAEEALGFGLVSQVVPDDGLEAALEAQLDRIRPMSPVAMALGRRAYEAMLDMPRHEAIAHGGLALVQLMATEDGRGAARAHAEGRHPEWTGR